jgi:hypothetical protein
MPTVYATPSDFWQLALPPDTLFQDKSIESGDWSAVVKTGVGTGFLDLHPDSNPRDVSSVVTRCISGGELTIYGELNPSPTPTFAISLNNGLTFGIPQNPNEKNWIPYTRGGFTLQLKNGAITPSFVAGDEWKFTTTPSPFLVRALSIASRIIDMYLSDTYHVPLSSWGDDIVSMTCDLARWEVIKHRGLNKSQDFMVYDPQQTMKTLLMIARGELQPNVVESGAPYVFPMVIIPRQKYATDWRP